jgi:hypothetical protein
MKYIDYVNYLKSNNIILFDHDYRISFFNMKFYLNKTMKGGGHNNNFLSKYNKVDLNQLVQASISSYPHYLTILAKH